MLQSVNVEAITEEILTAKGTFSLDFKMEGMMELTGEVSLILRLKSLQLMIFI